MDVPGFLVVLSLLQAVPVALVGFPSTPHAHSPEHQSSVETHPSVDSGVAPGRGLEGKRRPLSLLLLVDLSASMLPAPQSSQAGTRDQRLRPGDMRRIIERIASLLEPDDCGILGTFGAHIRVSEPCVPGLSLSDASSRLARVPDLERHGPSPVWDAIAASLQRLEAESGRRAILLITDGLSTGNRLGLDEVAARARREEVVVSVLGVPARRELPQTEGTTVVMDPAVLLKKLALSTGGEHVEYRERNRAPTLVDGLVAGLRQRPALQAVR